MRGYAANKLSRSTCVHVLPSAIGPTSPRIALYVSGRCLLLLFPTPAPSQSQHENQSTGVKMVTRKELSASALHSKPATSVNLLKSSIQASSSVAQLHIDAQDVALSSMPDPISATTSCDRPSAVSSYHQLQASCDVLLSSLPYADNGAAQNVALLLARANRELRVQIALLQAQLSQPTAQRPSPHASQLTLRERTALAECESPAARGRCKTMALWEKLQASILDT